MRLAIVNDLSLAREGLKRLVLSTPGYEIAWFAENGAEAVENATRDRPDIILMDLVMPVLDGVEATRQIMATSPCPILLVTSSVSGNLNQVYAAMGYGGLDAVNTPTFGPGGAILDGEPILARIAKLARSQQGTLPRDATTGALWSPVGPATAKRATQPPLVVLGASTGGPEAVAQVLSWLPADFSAPVIVVQHIAADFAPGLAQWLATRSHLAVRLARAGELPVAGTVLLAGTNDHLVLRSDLRLSYSPEPVDYPYRPSIDAFWASAARFWPTPGVAALLTGMGSDGARGLLLLSQAGWYTIAQDRATSVVYGMPKAAVEMQAAQHVLPLPKIGPEIRGHLPKVAVPPMR